jgi:hypothetical protein
MYSRICEREGQFIFLGHPILRAAQLFAVMNRKLIAQKAFVQDFLPISAYFLSMAIGSRK